MNFRCLLVWFAVCSLCGSLGYAGEPTGPLSAFAAERSWSDQSGRFKITAKLQFADSNEVKLLKPDAKVVTVPLQKLSDTDQAFIDGFLKAEAAFGSMNKSDEESPDNPFAGGESAGDVAPMDDLSQESSNSSASAGSNEIPQRQAIVKGFRPLSIIPAKAFWSVPPLRPFPSVQFEEALIQTGMKKPFFAGMRAMAAGKNGTVVLNAYQQGRSPEENYGRFVVVDASTGDSSEVFEFDKAWKILAITPDASRIAAVRVEGFDKGNDLAIFRIVDGALKPEFQFTAGGGSWNELHFAAFLPGNKLATISQKHELTIWDLSNKVGVKAVQRGSSGGALTAELSPASDLMALLAGSSIALISTESMKLVGCITNEEAPSKLAFSSDGTKLALFKPFRINIHSMETGEIEQSFAVSESNPNSAIYWVGSHLMVGAVLYDVQRSVPVWTYESRNNGQTALGDYVFTAFGNDNGSTLTIFKLPHDEALRAAQDVDPQNIYSIVPGDSIAVEYQLPNVPPNLQQQIRQAVEQKLTKLDWKVSNSSPNQMLIKLEAGTPDTAEYYTRTGFGPGPFFAPPGFGPQPSGPSEKIQFTPWSHTMTITSGGKQVFNATLLRTAPQNLMTKDGETTQAAVARICQPTPDYFSNLAIPPHLLKPEYQGGLGKSTISSSGIK